MSRDRDVSQVWSIALTSGFITRSSTAMLLGARTFRCQPNGTGVLIGSLALGFAAFARFTYTSIWTQSVHGLQFPSD